MLSFLNVFTAFILGFLGFFVQTLTGQFFIVFSLVLFLIVVVFGYFKW